MNVPYPRIAYLEMERRLRAAEQQRRARRARAAARSSSISDVQAGGGR